MSVEPVKLTEGQISKGGQNPPNMSTKRPPPPRGSGSKLTRVFVLERMSLPGIWELLEAKSYRTYEAAEEDQAKILGLMPNWTTRVRPLNLD